MAPKPSPTTPSQAVRCPRKPAAPSTRAAAEAKVAPAARAALYQTAATPRKPLKAPDPQSMPIFIGVPEVARRLGIGQTSAWALLRDHKLVTVKLGRRTLVPVEALEAFAASLQRGF